MRGKESAASSRKWNGRITPAYAGKSTSRTSPSTLFVGSPPPMRGKETGTAKKSIDTRITPAYAGKSRLSAVPPASERDHPRLCGEKSPDRIFPDQHQGSPPPMRGKAGLCIPSYRNLGITPAYAGKRHIGRNQYAFCQDHPRLCGEKYRRL